MKIGNYLEEVQAGNWCVKDFCLGLARIAYRICGLQPRAIGPSSQQFY